MLLVLQLTEAYNVSILRSIRECFRGNSSIVCLKERAFELIDEAVISDQPLQISDYVDIVRDPAYKVNMTDETDLPKDMNERSDKLNDMISRRVDDFFESRTVKFNLARVFEGIYKRIYLEVANFYKNTFAKSDRIYWEIIKDFKNRLFVAFIKMRNFLPELLLGKDIKLKTLPFRDM